MDRYIGLDAHASSCTLEVLGPGGKRLGSHVVETNAKVLICIAIWQLHNYILPCIFMRSVGNLHSGA